MEKMNYGNERHFSLLPEEIEKAEEEGNLEQLQASIEAANAKVQAGQEPELVIEGDDKLANLLEQREKIKEASRAHDDVELVDATDLGSEIDREMAEEEGDEEKMAA